MTTIEYIPADASVRIVHPHIVDPDPQPGELIGYHETGAIIAEMRDRADRVEPWHVALLRAIGQWSIPQEYVAGRRWRYVIGGEALDWLTLAQRLCQEMPDLVPPDELEALLFRGQLPQRIGEERFRELIGPYRYTAVLNFRYGVVVEEAVQLVVEDAIRKSRLARCYQDSDAVIEEAYRHLYGDDRDSLARQFLAGGHGTEDDGTWEASGDFGSFAAWQEFTYWLFKRRVRKWHPARVASDTRRGLERLRELHESLDADVIYGGESEAGPLPGLMSGGRK